MRPAAAGEGPGRHSVSNPQHSVSTRAVTLGREAPAILFILLILSEKTKCFVIVSPLICASSYFHS